jgi:protein-disulfide isomerase
MRHPLCYAVAAIAIAGLTLLAAGPSHAQALRGEIEAIIKDYLAEHPEEVERIVKDYLGKHPEVLQQSLVEMLKKRKGAPGTAAAAAAPPIDKSAAIKSNAKTLFESTHQVALGNPQGDVTMVEFFDYNCGFCKRALADMLDLMKGDPKLKVVLKEFPILGPGSVDVAKVAIAVRMQDPDGTKYLEFHRKLLGDRGHADKAHALEVAKELGLDVARIEADLASDEVRDTLDESFKLAKALGMNGTPSYVIGDGVVVGAVGIAALGDKVKVARQ